MNRDDCRTVLSLICMNLDRQVPEGLDALWAVTLADIPAEYGKAAAMECITSSPYMPKVSDIRDRAAALMDADRRAEERKRRLAIERGKPPAPERRVDGAQMAAWVWTETRRRAKGITDPAKRAEIADAVVAEWRRDHPDSTSSTRTGQDCGRAACRCTHTDGCDAGWVTAPDDGPAFPCRNCNPRRYQILSAGDRRSVAMANLRDTSDVKGKP